jgi:transcriptional regulator with XRE-family HTH domain
VTAKNQTRRLWQSRRRRAAALFAKGLNQTEIAETLGISRPTANQWFRDYKRLGVRGLVELRRYAGRPPGRRSPKLVTFALLCACALPVLGANRALGAEPEPSSPQEHHHEPVGQAGSPMVERLWKDLVCLCGRCPRQPLATCECPNAAVERRHIEDLLRGLDVSSPGAQAIAYQKVVEDYKHRFPGHSVLATESEGWPAGAWAALGGALAAVAVAISLVERNRRRSERKRAQRRSPGRH